jgi:DNA processing protein
MAGGAEAGVGAPRGPGDASGGRGGRRDERSGVIGALSAPAPELAVPPGRCHARGDAAYPGAFEALADPPARVHVWGGDIPDHDDCAAIVGSRAATPYGLAIAERLARDLAAAGVTVVSGLARGIDSAAHAGALAAGGRTLAVIASGIEQVPAGAPARLAGAIFHSGAVLSEVGTGGPFGKGAFVKRNRLIAACAAVTVVVEAAEDGGGLTTAAAARAIGRTVLAVPGDLDRPASRGTLALLRTGARVCGDAGDVLAAMGPRPVRGSDPDSRLRARLGDTPLATEILAQAAGLEVAEALARLWRLQLSGLAESHAGGRWSARRSR